MEFLADKKIEQIKNLLFLTDVKQITELNCRFYVVDLGGYTLKLKSVTTILSLTKSQKDKQSLLNWRNSIGNEQADLVCETSLNRGTVMHDCLDYYYEDFNLINAMEKSKIKNSTVKLDYIKNGQKLFINLYKSGFLKTIAKSIAREVKIFNYWKENDKVFGYSGTVDHFCQLINGKIVVIDYKNSIKPKPLYQVKDYIYQVCAYIKALEFMTDLKNLEGEIWIACQSGEIQKFELNCEIIEKSFNKFKEKIKSIK